MSPEQASGAANLDGRSDVYSLGCVLFEMLTGKLPHTAPTPQAVLAKKLADPLPSLAEAGAQVPPTVEDVVARALANQPDGRFPTGEAFGSALAEATTAAAIERDAQRRRRERRRRRSLVGAGAALLLGAGWWVSTIITAPAIRSIAVLPVAGGLNDPDQEALVHGMVNGLISELGRAGIKVIGGVQSMMQYQGTDKTVREIAQELRVDAIVESSVFWVEDSVGITANLVDGDTEEFLWSRSYNEASENLLDLYRSVTRAIAQEIHLALTPEAEARLTDARPLNRQAHEAYLQGRFHSSRLTQVDLETAIQYFEQALTFDPEYAPAYAGISWAWIALQQVGFVSPEVAAPLARAAALQAAEYGPDEVSVQHVLGTVGWIDWDWEAAEAGYRRAIEINPSYGDARADYSHLLLVLKRFDEAIAQVDTAIAHDPFNVKFQAFRGVVLVNSGRFEEGMAQFDEVLRVWPNHPIPRFVLPELLSQLGREEEAIESAVLLFNLLGDPEMADLIAQTYTGENYRETMRRAAEALEARMTEEFVPPVFVWRFYSMARDREKTLEWLELGYEALEPDMPYIGTNPGLGFLHDEPRFQELMRRLRLPE
jgi:TolB-like protein